MARPNAALTPIAGAPRTTMSRMASATSGACAAFDPDFFARQQTLVEQEERFAVPAQWGDLRRARGRIHADILVQ